MVKVKVIDVDSCEKFDISLPSIPDIHAIIVVANKDFVVMKIIQGVQSIEIKVIQDVLYWRAKCITF